MAANLAALRAALVRLGTTAEVANEITATQGIDTIEELRILTDDEVETLCHAIRRPGGLMPNPAFNAAGGAAAAVAAGIPAQITHTGHVISARAENNIKLAAYFLRFKERTSRAPDAASITLANVRSLLDHKKWEETHDDVDAPTLDEKDWPHTIEAIEEWFRGCLGDSSKIPLAYVIRTDEDPAGDPAAGWTSKADELIGRAPIRVGGNPVPNFLADNIKVWELLSGLTRKHTCWTYVKPFQRARDGRGAFLALRNHYLGPNNVDNMASLAEKKLAMTTYTGERHRWTFEKYVMLHKDQHSILEGLTEHGYVGIDERSKVRYLLDGIKTDDLNVIKGQILATATLRNDFDACVTLFRDYLLQIKADKVTKHATIAAVTTNETNHEEHDKVTPDMAVEDRYYKIPEYKRLSRAKKLGLKLISEKRGGKKTTKIPKKPGSSILKKKLRFTKNNPAIRKIKAILSAVELNEDDDMDIDSTANDTQTTTDPNNHTNLALQRGDRS